MRNLRLRLPKNFKAVFPLPYLFIFATVLSFPAISQELPNKIRGYKVHKARISVHTDRQSLTNARKPSILLDSFDIEIAEVSITKTVWEVRNDLTIFGQSGKVDFISFKDFQINGTNIEVEEYRDSFSFDRGQEISLKKPIRIFIGILSGLKVAAREFRESEKKWRITGRAFVFGRFKKSFFKFKRVIPVDIDIYIANPFNTSKKKRLAESFPANLKF